jgi:hypothetical protein
MATYAEQLDALVRERDNLKRQFEAMEARADREGRLFSGSELDEMDTLRRGIRSIDVRMDELKKIHEPATRTTTRTFTLSVKNPTE